MGRGRMGAHKVVPPPGWRWSPPASAYNGCVGRSIKDGMTFFDATQKCKGTRNSGAPRRGGRGR